MPKIFSVVNGPAPGAAATPKVTSAAVVKTMLQLATSVSREATITEYWWEGDGSSAATPFEVELLRHGGGAATVTAYATADICKVNDAGASNSLMTLGTAASGYTASAEGTMTTPFNIEKHLVSPTAGIYIQFPLGREPVMSVSTFSRIRNTGTPAVGVTCGVMWEE